MGKKKAAASKTVTTARGRPSVLDEVKRGEICAILSVGGSRNTAASYVGCATTTITRTAARDTAFGRKLARAESQWEVHQLRNIQQAARQEKYWRAAAWALERIYPDRYGPRKPGIVPQERMNALLTSFATIVTREVPAAAQRKRILKRLSELSGE
jgi:hypothetical protein